MVIRAFKRYPVDVRFQRLWRGARLGEDIHKNSTMKELEVIPGVRQITKRGGREEIPERCVVGAVDEATTASMTVKSFLLQFMWVGKENRHPTAALTLPTGISFVVYMGMLLTMMINYKHRP